MKIVESRKGTGLGLKIFDVVLDTHPEYPISSDNFDALRGAIEGVYQELGILHDRDHYAFCKEKRGQPGLSVHYSKKTVNIMSTRQGYFLNAEVRRSGEFENQPAGELEVSNDLSQILHTEVLTDGDVEAFRQYISERQQQGDFKVGKSSFRL